MKGSDVRSWRSAMRLRTQAEAAELLDVSHRTYHRMEREGATVLESLSLSRALVEAMDGAIGHAPRADGREGACFWVELPVSAMPLAADLIPGDPAVPAPAHRRPATILLIEDNLANAQLIEAVIVRHLPDARLLNAMQARIGLELALQHRPDLVLLDLHLPDRGGDWVLDELQRAVPDLAVILLTADVLAAQADWFARGAQAVLTKPIDVPALAAELEQVLAEGVSPP